MIKGEEVGIIQKSRKFIIKYLGESEFGESSGRRNCFQKIFGVVFGVGVSRYVEDQEKVGRIRIGKQGRKEV